MDDSKALVRRFYDEVYNQRRPEVVDELLSADFVSHLTKGQIDLVAYKQAIAGSLMVMPDLRVEIEDQIAEGDKVVTRWRAHATPAVPFAGLPAGQPMTVTAMHMHRVWNGKLVEHWEAINLHAATLE